MSLARLQQGSLRITNKHWPAREHTACLSHVLVYVMCVCMCALKAGRCFSVLQETCLASISLQQNSALLLPHLAIPPPLCHPALSLLQSPYNINLSILPILPVLHHIPLIKFAQRDQCQWAVKSEYLLQGVSLAYLSRYLHTDGWEQWLHSFTRLGDKATWRGTCVRLSLW